MNAETMSVGRAPDQTTLRRAILDPLATVPDGITDDRGRPALRRFAVYRNNVVVSLTEALETAFPVVAGPSSSGRWRARSCGRTRRARR